MENKTKKIVIYGAGNYGRTVINMLKRTKHICIKMVCDSDKKKWGKKCEGYVICPPSQIFEEIDLDGVFISILADNNVEQYILSKKRIKIYKKIYELVAENIYWDISGNCNAKCKYCVTGRNNREHKKKNLKNSYLSIDEFKKSYNHLYERGIISKESHLGLFNWKEPFLNPDIIDILNYCSKEKQRYNLSTNASVFRFATEKTTYSLCEQIIFSMPGFSQQSYDRIHGFSFNTIKENILKIKEDMLEHGFIGNFVISAHIYRFSECELGYLKEWARKENFLVNAYYPYLAGNSLVADYFNNRLDKKTIEDISTDLFLQWENEIDQECVNNFINPICNNLTIDEKSNITLCCAADEFCDSFANWGKVEDLNSYDDYKKLKIKMLKSETCKQCREYSMAYRILH